MRIDPKKMELYLARACMSETDLRNGTSPQTLLRIRRGMEVKPKTAGRIARALGVDVTDMPRQWRIMPTDRDSESKIGKKKRGDAI